MMVEGLICIDSVDGYAATIDRLDAAMLERGITPMLRIDHAAAAAAVGLPLHPLLLLLFGDPRVGTDLMQEKASSGIDLPLKLLVWQTEEGQIRIGYNDPGWIRSRHGITQARAASDKMEQLLQRLIVAASGISGRC
ncbi:DUF302 domain-containing protein [Sphingomonas glacialis]|uniref:DUF302 domain-containing protein n=1 Tax=Sphingomonas glacialis TaxID=658225 RepID=A0A502FT29_9SPHN|nr:DUF302 domain-containing protein [Sphingomonas glacialis]TPG52635.1 DUF302 domain-containing protein [Sphingomonas glacialis]